MKLLSVSIARSVWLGHLSDLNPRGVNLFPIIAPVLQETYKFITYPSLQDISNIKDGLKFEKGEFVDSKGIPVRINLSIYDDGLVVDSGSSTDHADAFLKDMLTKFDETFKLVKYNEVIKQKKYFSELYVATNKSLELLNPQLKIISEYLSNNVEENKIFETGGISFFPDQTNKINPASFRFERALNVPFSEKRYYSTAPLQTHKHLELLDKLEKILVKK